MSAQQLVEFITALQRFQRSDFGSYVYEVTLTLEEPRDKWFETVKVLRRNSSHGHFNRLVMAVFDPDNTIWRVVNSSWNGTATRGISMISDLIGSITDILGVQLYFKIIEVSGDLVKVEVFANPRCQRTKERNQVKVALITADQEVNQITEFQSLI